MDERLNKIKSGDMLLFNNERNKCTICLIVVYENNFKVWHLYDLSDGNIIISTHTKESLINFIKSGIFTDIIPKETVINQINMKLDGKYKYPIVERKSHE